MAASGTWSTQNQILPGVYFKLATGTTQGLTVGTRGTVAICEPLTWGPVAQVNLLESGQSPRALTGYDTTELPWLQQIFAGSNRTSGASRVYLYRPAATSATAAEVETGALTATALYPGSFGNNITIVITADPDNEGSFAVSTVVNGEIADTQTAETADTLTANEYVSFSGTGALTATVGAPLVGGADGTVQASAYSDFLTAIEPYQFDVLIYDGTDTTVQNAMVSFVKRMFEENGQIVQLVAANLTNPDSYNVINVGSGYNLNDGTTMTPQQAAWWVGGAVAGASYNESLTNATVPNAVSVTNPMSKSQREAAISAGQFILDFDTATQTVRVVQDINSLVTYTPEIGEVYHKNRVIRLVSTIANDLRTQFSESFLGIVNNNEEGRNRFKTAVVGYLTTLQNEQAIQNFSPDDVEVLPGEAIDAIVLNIALQVVDAVEKVYVQLTLS